MFLQTLVQLHILLAATPALAGWSLLPSAQTLPAHVYYLVTQKTAGEASPVSAASRRVIVIRRAALPAIVRPQQTMIEPPAPQDASIVPAYSSVMLNSYHPYPHAARAP